MSLPRVSSISTDRNVHSLHQAASLSCTIVSPGARVPHFGANEKQQCETRLRFFGQTGTSRQDARFAQWKKTADG